MTTLDAHYDLPASLRVECDGPVRKVVLDRPEQRNAIDRDLHWALAHVWGQLRSDPDARVVILTGAGRTFSGGGDLDWISSFLDDEAARDESLREGEQIITELLDFPLPVIAAVNGPAVGLGCSIAALCDVTLIADDAWLADPHISLGLAAGDGGAAFWPLLTPLLRSREYLLTGERIPATLAVELGLASRVVPAEELDAEATALAERLVLQSPEALAGTKAVLNLHLAQALGVAVPAGFAAERLTMSTDEHRRRLEALRRRTER